MRVCDWSDIKLHQAMRDIKHYNKKQTWPDSIEPTWVEDATDHLIGGEYIRRRVAIVLVTEEFLKRSRFNCRDERLDDAAVTAN